MRQLGGNHPRMLTVLVGKPRTAEFAVPGVNGRFDGIVHLTDISTKLCRLAHLLDTGTAPTVCLCCPDPAVRPVEPLGGTVVIDIVTWLDIRRQVFIDIEHGLAADIVLLVFHRIQDHSHRDIVGIDGPYLRPQFPYVRDCLDDLEVGGIAR